MSSGHVDALWHWWARFRIRWRRRTSARRQQIELSLEFGVTIVIIVWAIGVAKSEYPDGAKVAIFVGLGTLEIVFLAFRFIMRALRKLGTDSLTVIPRNELSEILYKHLDSKRAKLLGRAERLAKRYDCDLEKHEMYEELISLTNVVTDHRAGHNDAQIHAISSVNVTDFSREPLAEAYLEANRKAVARHVVVQRLFVLDTDPTEDEDQVMEILRMHAEALTTKRVRGRPSSGVRWLLKTEIPSRDDCDYDFAMFAGGALVTQAAGNRYELSQDGEQIERAMDVFTRLWSLPAAREPGRAVS